MRPALNPLVLSLQESATLAINQRALELRRAGEEVCHFGFGQAAFPVPEQIQAALRAASGKNRYLPTLGLPSCVKRWRSSTAAASASISRPRTS